MNSRERWRKRILRMSMEEISAEARRVCGDEFANCPAPRGYDPEYASKKMGRFDKIKYKKQLTYTEPVSK